MSYYLLEMKFLFMHMSLLKCITFSFNIDDYYFTTVPEIVQAILVGDFDKAKKKRATKMKRIALLTLLYFSIACF